MIAVHLGVVDEKQIEEMSLVFFESVIAELGHKLNYDAIVNYAGNSFCEKAWEMISDSNPFNLTEDGKPKSRGANSFASLINSSNIKVLEKE